MSINIEILACKKLPLFIVKCPFKPKLRTYTKYKCIKCNKYSYKNPHNRGTTCEKCRLFENVDYSVLLENIDYVECKICSKKAKQLGSHLLRVHKISINEYKTKYNSSIVCEKSLVTRGENISKNRNHSKAGKKISDSLTGKKLSKEHKDNISKGVNNMDKDSWAKKISEANKGKKKSKEWQDKISKSLKQTFRDKIWKETVGKERSKKISMSHKSSKRRVKNTIRRLEEQNLFKFIGDYKNIDYRNLGEYTDWYDFECLSCKRAVKGQLERLSSISCECYNKYNRKSETSLKLFIKEIGELIDENNRKIIKNPVGKGKGNNYEIDILIPDKKLAIEYNGLWCHSEKFKVNNYHLYKTEEVEKKGYQLIHVFSDEWENKKDIVRSRLKSILNKCENKIYARKCEVQVVSNKVAREFLTENHLQGAINSKINIGLFYSNELISLMTFGAKRNSISGKSEINEYELLRFCNKLDYYVIGGASKLFRYFVNTYNPDEILSYADRAWSKGDLYTQLGFTLSHKTKPNYYYIVNNKRENRLKFQKFKLVQQGFDKNKTEKQIMLERGLYRLYDSGSLVFKWKKTTNS